MVQCLIAAPLLVSCLEVYHRESLHEEESGKVTLMGLRRG